MPEETLLEALEEDTRNQCAAIIREAEETAERIVKEAQESAERTFEARLTESREAIDRARAFAINSARTRMSGAVLDVRHSLIDEVFAGVVKKITAMPKAEYARLLNRLYSELKGDWVKAGILDKPSVLVNPSDAGLIADAGADIKADASVSPGVVFVSPDGKLRLENTVSSRITKARTDLVPAVNKLLFG